jgi:hypothetical protein
VAALIRASISALRKFPAWPGPCRMSAVSLAISRPRVVLPWFCFILPDQRRAESIM